MVHPASYTRGVSNARVVVLIPLKGFGVAKERLSLTLTDPERSDLARSMADVVVGAGGDLPVVVITDDGDVARWADQRGARLLYRPARGLNDAVQHAVATLATEGIDRVVVAHGDLPLASGLDDIGAFEGITLVPDRHRDGTNVLCVPAAAGFRFAYGPGSFTRHVAEAERLGLPRRVVADSALGWDIDHPDDLAELQSYLLTEH